MNGKPAAVALHRTWLFTLCIGILVNLAGCPIWDDNESASTFDNVNCSTYQVPRFDGTLQDVTVGEGQSAQLQIKVVGTSFNLWHISGPGNRTRALYGSWEDSTAKLNIRSAEIADDGASVQVELPNECGTNVWSNVVTLRVIPAPAGPSAPAISSQPAPLTAADRGSAAFFVDADGTPPLLYQWFRDGAPIPGATDQQHVVAPVAPADDGARFSVTVTNALGSVTSNEATLTVQDAALLRLVRHAGNLAGAGNADGDARNLARFDTPMGVVRDAAGFVYVADTLNGVIRRIDPDGKVEVLAGSPIEKGHRDGTGAEARFTSPVALALNQGMLYVADWNHTLRRIDGPRTVTPVVRTLAGKANEPGAVDGFGEEARFNGPSGLAFDSDDVLYVADEGSHIIRRVDVSTLEVSTFAGSRFGAGTADGDRGVAQFRNPRGLSLRRPSNELLVADTGNHTVRSIDRLGQVTTIAGVAGQSGFRDSTVAGSLFTNPTAVVALDSGIYVADSGNHRIRLVAFGSVSTFAGSGAAAGADGPRLQAAFNTPVGMSHGGSDQLLVADLFNHAIRVVSAGAPTLAVSTLAGQMPRPGANDGHFTVAGFRSPAGLAGDAAGRLWIADADNHLLRRVEGSAVSKVAGLAGGAGTQDGNASQARFDQPRGIAFDAAGFAWVTQRGAIRRVDPTGNVNTVLQAAASGNMLSQPDGIAIDAAGRALVADRGSHRILRVDVAGQMIHIAGSGNAGHADALGAAAQFNTPHGLVIDGDVVYVADTKNHVIRRITGNGQVSTFVGAAGQPGSADGLGAQARLREPAGLAIGRGGHLYVADRGNHTLRRISPAGEVTTIAGVAGIAGFAQGLLPGLLARPESIAVVDSSLFITMEHGVVELRDYP